MLTRKDREIEIERENDRKKVREGEFDAMIGIQDVPEIFWRVYTRPPSDQP
jgi:hypothetical protein